ncbi:MAG: hypothetical protein HY331_02870 [Chloroflexi bacterium]|nr:hypothetical protein [Chloroflexota bacterium]
MLYDRVASLAAYSDGEPAIQLNAEKTARTAPLIAVSNEPEGRSAVPVAPIVQLQQTRFRISLPIIARGSQSSGGW